MSDKLARTLTFADLALLAVGSVIGSGIFLVPAAVLRDCGGHVGLALAVWLLAGVLCVLGALTYGELGAMLPEAGGLYVYIRDAFGPFVAFLYGWTLFLVIASGAVATLAVAFATYVQEFEPLSPLLAIPVDATAVRRRVGRDRGQHARDAAGPCDARARYRAGRRPGLLAVEAPAGPACGSRRG